MIKTQPSAGLLDFAVPPPNYEAIKYTYYSRKVFATSDALTTKNFFSDQVGVSSATLRDTNMTKPNAIANPKRFLAQWMNFRVYTILAADMTTAATIKTTLSNVNAILVNGVFQIKLLDKEYLTIPALDVPAGGGMVSAMGGAASALDGAATPVNGVPSRGNAYPLELPLEREASFTIDLLFPASGIVALSAAGSLYGEVCLTGILLRPRQ